MIPFDGQFAQETILPLTFTAYVEPWNAKNDPVLASFDSFAEILVDTDRCGLSEDGSQAADVG